MRVHHQELEESGERVVETGLSGKSTYDRDRYKGSVLGCLSLKPHKLLD